MWKYKITGRVLEYVGAYAYKTAEEAHQAGVAMSKMTWPTQPVKVYVFKC